MPDTTSLIVLVRKCRQPFLLDDEYGDVAPWDALLCYGWGRIFRTAPVAAIMPYVLCAAKIENSPYVMASNGARKTHFLNPAGF